MIELLIETSEAGLNLAILILRLAIGPCFVVHALGKLGLVGNGNMQGFESWLKNLGLPAPALQARMAMLAELLGGICIVLGFLYRPALLVLFFTMMIASFLGHKGAGYLITNNPPGREYALNLAILCIVMALLGSGPFSLDHFLFSANS